MSIAASDVDIDLEYLQAEMARIDLRIRREVIRCQLAGQDPDDDFRGLYVSDAHAQALLARPFGASWGQTVELAAEEARALADLATLLERQSRALADLACQEHRPLRLERLVDVAGLSDFDRDAFLVCLAPALDLGYEKLFGYLQDDVTHRRASVSLVLDLLCEPGGQRLQMASRFSDDAPLFRHRLLERVAWPNREQASWLNQGLQVDEAIVRWLLGGYQPHTAIRPYVQLVKSDTIAHDRLLSDGAWQGLECALEEEPLFIFHGPDEAAQRATARLVAAELGRPLLELNLAALFRADGLVSQALTLILRDAALLDAVPFLTGYPVGSDASPALSEMLSHLDGYSHVAIIASDAQWQTAGHLGKRRVVWLDFPLPAHQQRLRLWRHFLRLQVPSSTLHRQDLSSLAGQFALSTEQVGSAVVTARDAALNRGAPLAEEHLFAAARAHSNPRLASLARKITPRYTWDDIVLPDDQLGLLHEIVATVRGRPQVLDEWGVGEKLASSAGVTMLFAGPPGTGKTMAAEVIASELRLDLYKIDLSTVVSKYIGETEQNLERIFSEAHNSNAILFFDEADAIFGKRSEVKDAHDRYANIEVSYLLQRMEAYDGVTVLATNLRANLDEAFTRRLQFAVDFPFPEEADRLRIWQTLFPSGVPRTPDLDFALLSRRFKLAGGSIRNVLVNAAFLAAAQDTPVTMELLLHSVRRELQKMGRLVDEGDLRTP